MIVNLYRLKRNINKALEDEIHRLGVPYKRKIIYSNGRWIDLVVPIFSGYTINIGYTVEKLWDKVRSSTKPNCSQKTIDKKAYDLAIDISFYKLREEYLNSPDKIKSQLLTYQWTDSQIQKLEGPPRCEGVERITAHHLPETNINDNTINMQFVFSTYHKAGHSGGSQCWNIKNLEICGTLEIS
ncbi:hypothetical protein [Parabacteroides gordonii]|uniref:Uncharacterized protein n=1 Tax=Parabacteroides gordonii MS-1 = DSM 23371 TaxID=1203610 RepID=A0A0F5JC21_9BACT|nr:hypothetical protein [Parabacteroides gordonii]KKB55314.1 hypothetical protein HMPREF1536_02779 [Parabacteroides gordonii MS-1 = DSM 23371]MCA5581891.1 hypothetical protein [Parabacteroides gordonii]